MIEDAELRELFQTESEEHLQSLDDGLLRLEAEPQNDATLEEVFRAAHSLKGTARMLGVSGVETLAHHLEDELGNARRGRVLLSPPTIDRLYAGLDAIRKLVEEAVTGVAAGVDISRTLDRMRGAAETDSAANVRHPSASGTDETEVEKVLPSSKLYGSADFSPLHRSQNASPGERVDTALDDVTSHSSDLSLSLSTQPAELAPAVAAPPSNAEIEPDNKPVAEIVESQSSASSRGDFKIQTMRVPPAKLDALMTLASELTVTTNRVYRGMAAFVEMSELWEEWSKDLANQRPLFNKLGTTTEVADVASRKLAAFHEREQERLARLQALWENVRQTVFEDVTRLSFVADDLEESIRNVRLLPLSTIFNLFPRSVRDLARDQSKEIQLLVEGGETTADKRILEELKDPLMHMLRNAVDHGIEPPRERERNGKPRLATIRLRAYQTATNVVVELRDDGRGLNLEAIVRTALQKRLHSDEELQAMTPEQIRQLIFAPGFSTSPLVTDVSGRGVGLDVVRINIENLKGSIHIDSTPGVGTCFTIRLPLTLATTRVLLVEVESRPYALPIEWIQSIVRVSTEQFFTVEGRETWVLDGEAISVVRLSQLLELRESTPAARNKMTSQAETSTLCVVVAVGTEKIGVLVDALLDEQEVVLKPLGSMLRRVRNVSGATILGAGEVCMVLNPHDLVKSAQRVRASVALPLAAEEESTPQRRKVILLAEDSITTRTQEKRILEGAGYEVVTAVDGADAFGKLATRDFDAVVSDVEMPNLDGLSLAAKIREDNKYLELPIILVTSLASDEDKRRGIEVGADAYITKGAFEQKVLLDTLRRLV